MNTGCKRKCLEDFHTRPKKIILKKFPKKDASSNLNVVDVKQFRNNK